LPCCLRITGSWAICASRHTPRFAQWKQRSKVFENMALGDLDGRRAGDPHEQKRRRQGPDRGVSTDFFSLVGVAPALGRGFLPEDSPPGQGHAIVLSHDFWQRQFGGDKNVLGQTVAVEGEESGYRRCDARGVLVCALGQGYRRVVRIQLVCQPKQPMADPGWPTPAGSDHAASPGRNGHLLPESRAGSNRTFTRAGEFASSPCTSGRWRIPQHPLSAARERRLCATHRLRQRCQPIARPGQRAPEGIRGARFARRGPPSLGPAVAYGKSGAWLLLGACLASWSPTRGQSSSLPWRRNGSGSPILELT